MNLKGVKQLLQGDTGERTCPISGKDVMCFLKTIINSGQGKALDSSSERVNRMVSGVLWCIAIDTHSYLFEAL